MARRRPLKGYPVNGQLIINQAADSSGQSLSLAFPKRQEKVEGEGLGTEYMSGVTMQGH
jgi:hypothetical protein